MKPKHRHELKTNELAEWLSNFPQWAKKNLRMIIYISIVIILAAGSYFWHRYQKNVISAQEQLELTNLIMRVSQSKTRILQAQAQGVDISYMLLQPAEDLKTLAQKTKNNQMAALALIKRAEALRAELHYRFAMVDKRDLEAQINLAKTSYTEAIQKSPANPSLIAMAKFGLGLCEEELGNFNQAKQIYTDITTNPDFKNTTVAVQAKQRLETMDDYQRKVVFKPSPKPAEEEPMQPEIQVPAQFNLGPQAPNNAFGSPLPGQ